MSSLRNSIKKADPAPEKKEEIMLNLNLLFELATSKCDHFKTQIADSLQAFNMHKETPNNRYFL